MKRTLLLVLSLLLSAPFSSALAAEAASWSTTFPADALASYLDNPPARYMLVPAGSQTLALTQAEQALAAALRSSGKAVLVMNAQALGPVAQKDDASIVQRGAGFPVDRVVVLRLFPDASGALTQAVVTLYDKAGQPRGAFSATQGTALTPRVAPAPEQNMAAAPESVPAPSPARPAVPGENPVEQYEQQYIGFDELVAVNMNSGTVVAQRTVPYEGKFKKPLQGDTFYKKVGREDLVRAYQDKMGVKTAVAIAGGAATVGGGILSAVSLNGMFARGEDCDFFSYDYNACKARNERSRAASTAWFLAGLGISTVGLSTAVVALAINPHPVTPSEARELADGYNKKLKSDLGLSEDGQPIAPPERPASIQARLSPVFRPGGGGLLLSGTF